MTAHALAVVAVIAGVAVPRAGHAQPARPPALANVGLDEHVGARLPLDARFTDTVGRRIQLGALFDGRRPVLLVLAYVRCKMLCSLVLGATTEAVRTLPLALGRDYRVVTVSIDPREDAASAAAKRRELLRRIGRPDDAAWTYLVGAAHPIEALADALGFRFAWDPHTEQFAHPAVVFVLTPDGRIADYLQGVAFDPARLAAALRGAARGELSPVTSASAESVLSCFHFDPALRAHREQIERYLQIGGAVIAGTLFSSVGLLFWWERRRRRCS